MILAESGVISLDDPVSKYLDGFNDDLRVYVGEDADGNMITEPAIPMKISHLLTHSSGIGLGNIKSLQTLTTDHEIRSQIVTSKTAREGIL